MQSFIPGLGTKSPCAAQHSQRNLKTGALRCEKTGPGPKPICVSLSPPPSWPLLSPCFPFSTQVDSGLLWAPLQVGGALLTGGGPRIPSLGPSRSPVRPTPTLWQHYSPFQEITTEFCSQKVLLPTGCQKNVLAYRAPTLTEANVLPELSEKKQVSKDQRTAAVTGETSAAG